MYRELVKSGDLKKFLEQRSDRAHQQKQALVESGMPDNMAEEIVLKELFE